MRCLSFFSGLAAVALISAFQSFGAAAQPTFGPLSQDELARRFGEACPQSNCRCQDVSCNPMGGATSCGGMASACVPDPDDNLLCVQITTHDYQDCTLEQGINNGCTAVSTTNNCAAKYLKTRPNGQTPCDCDTNPSGCGPVSKICTNH